MKTAFNYFFNFISRYRNHFIGWSLFIAYEVITVALIKKSFVSFGHYACFYIFNILLFYFHAHIIMPAAQMKTKSAFWKFPLFTLIELGVYVPLLIFTVLNLKKYHIVSVGQIDWTTASLTNIGYRGVYFIMFSSAYYFILNYLHERKMASIMEKQALMTIIEKQKVEKDLVSMQHAHLKAQINPHFLFNTLNFIYTNTRKQAPEAAEAIIKLSEIMRFAIEEMSDDNLSDLEEEVEHIENLVTLHQIKANHNLNIEVVFNNNVSGCRIIPLVLITMVENVFKHGDLTRNDDPAIISIGTEPGEISIKTRNLIKPAASHASHHIGIDNIRKRLQSTYGSNAVLSTTIQDAHFIAHLSIKSDRL